MKLPRILQTALVPYLANVGIKTSPYSGALNSLVQCAFYVQEIWDCVPREAVLHALPPIAACPFSLYDKSMCLKVLDACVCTSLSGSLLRSCVRRLQYACSQRYLPCCSIPADFPPSAWASEESLVCFRSLGMRSMFFNEETTAQGNYKKLQIIEALQDLSSFANFAIACSLWSDKWVLAAPPVCINQGFYEEYRAWQACAQACGTVDVNIVLSMCSAEGRQAQLVRERQQSCNALSPEQCPRTSSDMPMKPQLVRLLEKETAHIVMKFRHEDSQEVNFVHAWIPSTALPSRPCRSHECANARAGISESKSARSFQRAHSASVAHSPAYPSMAMTGHKEWRTPQAGIPASTIGKLKVE